MGNLAGVRDFGLGWDCSDIFISVRKDERIGVPRGCGGMVFGIVKQTSDFFSEKQTEVDNGNLME